MFFVGEVMARSRPIDGTVPSAQIDSEFLSTIVQFFMLNTSLYL